MVNSVHMGNIFQNTCGILMCMSPDASCSTIWVVEATTIDSSLNTSAKLHANLLVSGGYNDAHLQMYFLSQNNFKNVWSSTGTQ